MKTEGYKSDLEVFRESQVSNPYDGYSVYTVLVLLNDRSDYQGGIYTHINM